MDDQLSKYPSFSRALAKSRPRVLSIMGLPSTIAVGIVLVLYVVVWSICLLGLYTAWV